MRTFYILIVYMLFLPVTISATLFHRYVVSLFEHFIDPDRQTFLDPGWTPGFDHGPKSKNFDPGVQKSTSLSVRDFERKKRVF